MMMQPKAFGPPCPARPTDRIRGGGFGLAPCVLGVVLLGCGSGAEAPSEPGPLIDPTQWTVVAAPDDPFSDRPERFPCTGGFQVEGEVYEVETDKCAYLTASQPSLRSVRAGDRVETLMWHQLLVADVPAEAHMAVRLGPHVIAEARLALPFPPELYEVEWTTPEPVPAGTPVYIHVHNHGSNSYRFGSVELVAH